MVLPQISIFSRLHAAKDQYFAEIQVKLPSLQSRAGATTNTSFCIRNISKMKSKPAKKNTGGCFSTEMKATCKNSANLEQETKTTKIVTYPLLSLASSTARAQTSSQCPWLCWALYYFSYQLCSQGSLSSCHLEQQRCQQESPWKQGWLATC